MKIAAEGLRRARSIPALPWLLGAVAIAFWSSTAFCQVSGGNTLPAPPRETGSYGREITPQERKEPLKRPMEAPTPISPQARERLRQYERLSPEEKAKLRGRFEEWKSLPSEERESLRNRLERWRQLPPTDRTLLRERFEQWKTLRPEERRKLRERLRRPEELTPQEQEEIRERFRTR